MPQSAIQGLHPVVHKQATTHCADPRRDGQAELTWVAGYLLRCVLYVCVGKVLDDLGVGPSGPPIPPPVTLAVLPYPVEKLAEANSDVCHVCFVPLPEEM